MQDFGTKSDDTAGPSGQLSAAEFNNLATELENAVLRSGLALSGASVVQLATSMFLHAVKAQTFQDSGAANAYVATPVSGSGGVLLPGDYVTSNGSLIIFQAANTNSGASTLNIGQTTGTLLGTKAIVDESGAALTSGAITAGTYVQMRYDSSIGAGSWVLLPSSRAIASAAQAQAMISNLVLLTPLRLDDSFKGGNQSLATTGYQKLPGGLVLEWGVATVPLANTPFAVTFPLALSTAVYRRFASAESNSTTYAVSVGDVTLSGMNILSGTASQAVAWLIVGK